MADDIVLTIESEDDAWENLEQALRLDVPRGVPVRVIWGGWPHMEIKLPETPGQAVISPSMMEAFIELQTTIYRAHSLLSGGAGDLRTLTKFDKEIFEFHVSVEPGSSEYKIDLTEIVRSFGMATYCPRTTG
jgi:hypothetical protein